ncbi:ATP-binding cassette domain-containing protein [Gemmobacter fulvus]|uniref:Glutathione import ATP-binding protein GsiA n=1 Tax=Gemmobacter fulvus TaxID=2840474 RepID=A0A975P3R6_9RHOB|nr:oligopeptide/dipeptide ABC transporter ATP-binding protein [Gemmobacter fulvus]MBT9245897.1 ATP-binding cassette domain-containing protein [Gemmobacter fulvus]QWK89274.1 ATP-binding cassette domain-containing protein [Gemmobacter fulvus]
MSDPAMIPPETAALASDVLLSVEGLKVHYPVWQGWRGKSMAVKAVDGVDLTLRPGECLGLVGESGCGKSSIAQALLGLVPITAGRIRLDGHEITGPAKVPPLQLARSAQMVFQDPMSSLNPRQTIGEILSGPLRLHGMGSRSERESRVAEMLGMVGMAPAVASRYPHEFSGGQRQRLCIARALILRPKLVICDEPVSALDVSIRAQIINLLLELKVRLGIALLLISHDLGVVEHMSDRIAVMYLGRIVETGGWRQIFTAPSHPYTQALISAIPDPMHRDRVPARLGGEIPSALAPPPGCAFNPRCPLAFDRCRAGEGPAFTHIGPDHQARCHLLQAGTSHV